MWTSISRISSGEIYPFLSSTSCLWSVLKFEWAVAILSILAYVFFGILSILFSTRLLKLPYRFYGLLKHYCYITIASGVCFMMVILLPVGIVVGAVTDIILGIVFFRAAEEHPSAIEIGETPVESNK